jgi:hypothetical protein
LFFFLSVCLAGFDFGGFAFLDVVDFLLEAFLVLAYDLVAVGEFDFEVSPRMDNESATRDDVGTGAPSASSGVEAIASDRPPAPGSTALGSSSWPGNTNSAIAARSQATAAGDTIVQPAHTSGV